MSFKVICVETRLVLTRSSWVTCQWSQHRPARLQQKGSSPLGARVPWCLLPARTVFTWSLTCPCSLKGHPGNSLPPAGNGSSWDFNFCYVQSIPPYSSCGYGVDLRLCLWYLKEGTRIHPWMWTWISKRGRKINA